MPAPSSCSLPQHPPKPRSALGVSVGRGGGGPVSPRMPMSPRTPMSRCPLHGPMLSPLAACPYHPSVPTGLLQLQLHEGCSAAVLGQ